jgi:hypothetical protein
LLLIIIKASFPTEDLIKEWHAAEAGYKRCRTVKTRNPIVYADVQVICLQDILLRRLMPAIRLKAHPLISELAGLPGANVAFVVRLLVITLIINPVLIPPIQVLVQATGRSVHHPQNYLIFSSSIFAQRTAIHMWLRVLRKSSPIAASRTNPALIALFNIIGLIAVFASWNIRCAFSFFLLVQVPFDQAAELLRAWQTRQ